MNGIQESQRLECVQNAIALIGINQENPMINEDAIHKFYSKVLFTDSCWMWIGHIAGNNNYGEFTYKNKRCRAHRYSFMIRFGSIPVGLNALHRCDTPLCVNPDHLFLGTQRDNIYDAINKKRIPQIFSPNEKCIKGHLIAVTKSGKRECPTCKKEWARQYYLSHIDTWNDKRKERSGQ